MMYYDVLGILHIRNKLK